MIGSELKTFVESLIDDDIEDTLFYTLLNIAKDQIEDSREWEVLKKWDLTLTYLTGDTYLTPKTLPVDFRSMFAEGEVYLGENNPYFPVPYKDIYKYNNFARHYTIDYLNNKLYILGSEASNCSIYLPYLGTSNDIIATTAWAFPSRFHPLLGLMVAGFYTAGVDADDIYARMSTTHRIAAASLQSGLEKWNTRLALMAMGNSATQPLAGGRSDGRLSDEDRG